MCLSGARKSMMAMASQDGKIGAMRFAATVLMQGSASDF
jgi:hypothetical protein